MNESNLKLGLGLASLLLLLVALKQESLVPRAASEAPKAGAPPLTALMAIPESARFVVNLDLSAPAAAPLRTLLLDEARAQGGLGRLSKVCGYDPSPAIRQLAVAAFTPSAGAEPQFAFVASGSFEHDKLGRCAEELVRTRGGTPERSQAKALTLVRDTHRHTAEIAILDTGLVLVAEHEVLRQMLSVLDGHTPSTLTNPTHRDLRQALGAPRTAIATLDLDQDWLLRLFKDEDFSSSPLTGLRAVAVSLDLGERVSLEARLRCTTSESCQHLQRFLRDLEQQFSPMLGGPLAALSLSEATLEQRGSELFARWALSPKALQDLLTRLGSAREPETQAVPRALPSAPPNEVIPAKPRALHQPAPPGPAKPGTTGEP